MSSGSGGSVPDGAWAKLDGKLRAALQRDHGDDIPVLIRLTAGDPVGPDADAARSSFDARVAALVDELRRGGARDLRKLWIANAISASAPAAAVVAAALRPETTELSLLTEHDALL